MSSHLITPGPYRATKLWNEVTRLFRAGMPLRKHRQNFRHYASCFTASAAVDWLHQLLCSNSNFGPDVTRQQTVQLLKKFLKNHVIEDVKGRWGKEDLEDNNTLYRFPSTSPLKPIPCPAAPGSSSIKKRPSLKDKEGFFKFRSIKKHEKETQENVDPALHSQQEGANQLTEEQQMQRRELTAEDEQDIWRDITLTHLQRILGVASVDGVLDQRYINPQNIIHNMTKVNKHGVVTLDDKTNDLPHWVLSAMKSLANWPKYDSAQPSYPGFERDVFKTVSDYFYSLPQPLLTYELYELFINVLVFCGYVAAPAKQQRGKRKKSDLPSVPPPAKSSFRSTECLLLSLLRQGTCDETESPMREVLGGKLAALRGVVDGTGAGQLGGSCMSLNTAGSLRPQTRSCSLETILDDSSPMTQQQLFLSNDSLASCAHSNGSQSDSSAITTPLTQSDFTTVSKRTPVTSESVPTRNRLSVVSMARLSAAKRSCSLRPRSVGSCLDIVIETKEEDIKELKWQGRASSCLNVSTPASQQHSSSASRPPSLSSCHPSSSFCHPSSYTFTSAATKVQGSSGATGHSGPRPASSTSNLWTLPAPVVVRRCLSSLDVSKPPPRPVSLFKPPVCVPTSSSQLPQPKPEHSVLQPQCERVAIEALQLCTLLLPPSSRRKLQLLMRMMSRISQNVDMPRLHPAIGTRTLMVHTFSGCVLGSAEECDLDELLATRLVSFLMDHQESILSVPQYLLSAITDHVQYLRTVQVPVDFPCNTDDADPVCAPVPIYAFCRQISGAEFEQQKLESSQKAMEELLEVLLTDQNISEKDRRKKLKQFQKQYPDIYRLRFPSSDRQNTAENKPKIKPPLLNIKKTKAFSIRN
ncbi:DEP domain-containing protein 1A isoform X1 [Parambassis ranga]|uniref:DEP domain-containing protein 1A isoform X1 n=1 Tax=Parambassis ranga TaxID=210632 RepID=A0A6P7IF85_9TELE|nr:DEP domain-containing protein 1A isoform X1 [Parambassis ranga]XP_028259025.1 DEP domain-containing protein 1A isoform X1 [Parambassis ranga]XP_028259026.1 DEP domain-containing protein 1A isoform X1 [Parambassis ranga]